MKKYFRMFGFISSIIMFVYGVAFTLNIPMYSTDGGLEKLLWCGCLGISFFVPATIAYYSLRGTKGLRMLNDKLDIFVDTYMND